MLTLIISHVYNAETWYALAQRNGETRTLGLFVYLLTGVSCAMLAMTSAFMLWIRVRAGAVVVDLGRSPYALGFALVAGLNACIAVGTFVLLVPRGVFDFEGFLCLDMAVWALVLATARVQVRTKGLLGVEGTGWFVPWRRVVGSVVRLDTVAFAPLTGPYYLLFLDVLRWGGRSQQTVTVRCPIALRERAVAALAQCGMRVVEEPILSSALSRREEHPISPT